MQLIMDTEPAAEINLKDKMSALEEPLDTHIKDPIESIKNEIINGNKENIESQKNIIDATVNVNDVNLKPADSSETSTEIIERIIEEDKHSEKNDITTDDASEQNVCNSNVNEIISVCKDNDENNTCKENKSVEHTETHKDSDNVKKGNTLPNSVIIEDKQAIDDTCKFKENEIDAIEDAVIDNSVSNTDLCSKAEIINKDILNPDMDKAILEEENSIDHVKSNMEDGLLTENQGIDIEPVQSVTQKVTLKENSKIDINHLNVDSTIHSLDVINPDCGETHNIKNNVKISDSEAMEITETHDTINDDIPMDIEDAKSADVNIKSHNDIIENTVTLVADTEEEENMNESVMIIKDFETFGIDAETGETSLDDAVTKTLEILDTELNESKDIQDTKVINSVSNSKTDKLESTKYNKNKEDDLNIHSDKSAKINEESNSDVLHKDSIHKTDDDIVTCETENDSTQKINEKKAGNLDIDEFLRNTEVVKEPSKVIESSKAPVLKLSNTLDILSDDDEEPTQSEPQKSNSDVSTSVSADKQCINIEDDDDIMLIDEDTNSKDDKSEPAPPMTTEEKKDQISDECAIVLENNSELSESKKVEEISTDRLKDTPVSEKEPESTTEEPSSQAKQEEIKEQKLEEPKKPLLAENFMKGCKKNLADMTRYELEEFCITKIVEGIVDRSNLSEIKSKLKAMTQSIDEYKKKAMMLTKQNRDLQLVLKSVQEEQKKKLDTAIIPLKITRSVGMQVSIADKSSMKKKVMANSAMNPNNGLNNKVINSRNPNQSPRAQKPPPNTQQIPVPRLVPAATNPAVKAPNANSQTNSTKNTSQSGINGMKVVSPVQKTAEKRTFNRTHAVTVDLTDDEPPAKVIPRSSPAPPVRLVSPQNLLTRPQFPSPTLNSPRKVYIPISGPQSQNIRPGQTIMLKSVPPQGQRMRGPTPHTARIPQNQVRLARVPNNRHPAPLPDSMKQYQPPNWKALPPAPDLKLSKVENGIVISWKIEGYQEDSYEEIASYQLYAYQETSAPPSTALWKKIGDVKALPLPMACTLTQFMAGFKYYFAVRAVDIRSRLGPFSLPGSILLLNKM